MQQYNRPPPVPLPGQQQRQNLGRPLPRPLVVGGGPVLGALYHDHDVTTMSGDRMEAS
jgi:hypothetical protein